MIFDTVQESKELYKAVFLIRHGDASIGKMEVRGSAGSIDGDWDIALLGQAITMTPERKKNLSRQAARPYEVTANGEACGCVCLAREKHGLFASFDYVTANLQNGIFNLYSILFDEGGKCPIYAGERQIAQIDKDNVVYDDLHSYHIFALNESIALIPTLFCAYLYVIGHFKPGVKVKSGYMKYCGKTTNKLLLEKYDAGFSKSCAE